MLEAGQVDPTFVEPFPDRYFAVEGLECQSAMVWCGALAAGGCRPVVLLSSETLESHFEQVVRECCAPHHPVTFVLQGADRLPADRAHDPRYWAPAALARMLPKTTVMAPEGASELAGMLHFAVDLDSPAVILLPDEVPRRVRSGKSRCDLPLDFGRAAWLREGSDIGLVTFGTLVDDALEASETLATRGVDASVLDLRFVQPLDEPALFHLADRVQHIFAVEPHAGRGGVGTAVLEALSANGALVPVTLISIDGDAAAPLHPSDLIAARVQEFLPPRAGRNERARHRSRRARNGSAQARSISRPFQFQPEAAEHERLIMQSVVFSESIAHRVAEYEQIGNRPRFLWQWCQHGIELTTLPGVPPEWGGYAAETKFLSAMLNVLIDDVADQQGNRALLSSLLEMVQGSGGDFRHHSVEERRYAEFATKIWREYWERSRQFPCFEAFEDLLRYDLMQLFNQIRYTELLKQNLCLLNSVEHDLYSPHGMMLMSFATLDLMCMPLFRAEELGRLREAIWHAQSMSRIGNLVSTWQREIGDADFSSGVFARAIEKGTLTPEQLVNGEPEAIAEAITRGAHEEYFLRKWAEHRGAIEALAPNVRSVDLLEVIRGQERLLYTELGSRGFK